MATAGKSTKNSRSSGKKGSYLRHSILVEHSSDFFQIVCPGQGKHEQDPGFLWIERIGGNHAEGIGVNACKLLKLPFIGVLGILIRMREKNIVSGEEALRKLETLKKFGRYRPDIIEDVKRRLEEHI